MGEKPSNPHDAYFRAELSDPETAAGEIRAVLPAEMKDRFDWTVMERQSVSFVPAELRSRYSDILFRTRWATRDAFVYFLIEHQSSQDPSIFERIGPSAKEAMVTIADDLRAEGRVEGQAEQLVDQLSIKFGPLSERVLRRVRGADAATLRDLSRRFIFATSIDDVVAE
ncbi:Rpn family recombination-promoting nuclease/putative transposase [Nocardia sp. BMG111209]|uniref:Rpn family recombination-promoting nuclease/putative transposase n=1 Tax=Nocardia sp. BMG111209 TaxID=1160137 RepID=UPI00037C17FD|nr:Rpn family recombination-promoting nuclease/putative transposase [Nocardia sp. BMG111209]